MSHENLSWLLFSAWTLAALALLLKLHVFSPRSLDHSPPRHSSLTLGTVGAVILIYIGSLTFALSLATAFHWFPTPNPPPATTSIATHPAPDFSGLNTTVLQQALDAAAKLIASAFAFLLIPKRLLGGFDSFGISLRKLPRGLLLGLAAYLLAMPLVITADQAVEDLLQHFFHQTMTPHATLDALHSHPPLHLALALIFLAAVAAPILEEIFFRGLLQTALTEPSFGLLPQPRPDPLYHPSPARRWAAILLTSLLFAAVHYVPQTASLPPLQSISLSLAPCLVLFLFSLALSYTYERTNNLWAPITLHALFNTINILTTLYS